MAFVQKAQAGYTYRVEVTVMGTMFVKGVSWVGEGCGRVCTGSGRAEGAGGLHRQRIMWSGRVEQPGDIACLETTK